MEPEPDGAARRPPCPERAEPVSAVQVAVLVVVAGLIVYYLAALLGGFGGGEGFVSKRAREVYSKASEAFREGGGDATYTEYKKRVPGADPVQHHDVRGLYRAGRLTPEAVEGVLRA